MEQESALERPTYDRSTPCASGSASERSPGCGNRAPHVTPLDRSSGDCYTLGMRRNLRGARVGRLLGMALLWVLASCGRPSGTPVHGPPHASAPPMPGPAPSADAGVTRARLTGVRGVRRQHGHRGAGGEQRSGGESGDSFDEHHGPIMAPAASSSKGGPD